MSFQTLKKDILLQVAEDFAVDLPEDPTKADIISAFANDGVTWDMYKEAFPEVTELEDDEDKTAKANDESETTKKFKAPEHSILLKMTRGNGTYQVRGYKFTREHPFVLVTEDDANYILENIDGFKIASPREASEYYS